MIFNHSIINAAKAAERSESVSRNFHDLGIEPNFFGLFLKMIFIYLMNF